MEATERLQQLLKTAGIHGSVLNVPGHFRAQLQLEEMLQLILNAESESAFLTLKQQMVDSFSACRTIASCCKKAANNIKGHIEAKKTEDQKRPAEQAAAAQAAAAQQMSQRAKQAKDRLKGEQLEMKAVYTIDFKVAVEQTKLHPLQPIPGHFPRDVTDHLHRV